MARRRALLAASCLALFVARGGVARADEPAPDRQNTAAAKDLFDEGLKLMDAGKYVEACAKFAASNQSAAKVSTLLNLGNCYEKTGQLASAWGTYNEAIALARRTNRADYETFAQQRITLLEPKLMRLTIKVEADARVDGLVVKRDGVPVSAGGWDAAVPVDPGKHVIAATAPKKKAWERTVVVDESVPLATIVVTQLEDLPPEPAPATTVPITPPPPPPEAERPAFPRDAPPQFWTPQRTTGLSIAGGGVVGMGVGAILGLIAKSSYDDARGMCTRAPDACPQAAVDQSNHAYTMATVSTVLFVVGGLAVIGGGVVYFTASGAGVRGSF
jgi:serine/threonine-protein kinase